MWVCLTVGAREWLEKASLRNDIWAEAEEWKAVTRVKVLWRWLISCVWSSECFTGCEISHTNQSFNAPSHCISLALSVSISPKGCVALRFVPRGLSITYHLCALLSGDAWAITFLIVSCYFYYNYIFFPVSDTSVLSHTGYSCCVLPEPAVQHFSKI